MKIEFTNFHLELINKQEPYVRIILKIHEGEETKSISLPLHGKMDLKLKDK